MDDEQWRPVVGSEPLYDVSDHGRVRSHDRWIEQGNPWGGKIRYRKAGRILKPGSVPPLGYQVVNLAADGRHTMCYVHTLVLDAFVGQRPTPAHEARHKDRNPANNRVDNLHWGTHGDNMDDMVGHGTHYQAGKRTCPRRHDLIEPNMTPNIAKNGDRGCYACSLTHSWGKTRGLTTADLRWIAEADRRYAEIMHFGKPIRYSNTGRDTRWEPAP